MFWGNSCFWLWLKEKGFPSTNQTEWNVYEDEELELFGDHYENTPIQLYRKFHIQKLKIFR